MAKVGTKPRENDALPDEKTPAELMAGLLAMLMHWFPERKFVFAGDKAYGSHALARFVYTLGVLDGFTSHFLLLSAR